MLADIFAKPNDIFYLAEHRADYRGDIEVKRFPRLQESFSEVQTVPLSIHFCAGKNREAGYFIDLKIQGVLQLQCQRCVQPMEHVIDIHHRFALLTHEAFAERIPADYEPLIIEEDREFSIIHLVEDEVLLECPLLACHEHTDCNRFLNEIRQSGQPLATPEDSDARKETPFAVLEQLKNKKN